MVRENAMAKYDPGISLADWTLKHLKRHAKNDKTAQSVWYDKVKELVSKAEFGKVGRAAARSLMIAARNCIIDATGLRHGGLSPGGVVGGHATDGHTGKQMSYHDLLKTSLRFAQGIQFMGIKVDETVAILTRNYHEVFIAVLGCLFSGVTVAPSVPNCSPAELAHHLNLVAPRYVLVEKELLNTVLEAVELIKEVLHQCPIVLTLESDEFQAIIELGQDADPDTFKPVPITDRSDHVVFILYSSGTTGLSKGVMVTDVGLTSQMENFRSTMLNLRDTLLCSSPMSWITALFMLFSGTQHAVNRVFVRDSSPEFLLGVIEKYQIQTWMAAPTILLEMTNIVEAKPDQWDISSLTDIVVGGSTMAAEVQERTKRVLDSNVKQAYGCTETGLITFGDFEGVKMGSAGRAAHFMNLQVVDPDTERVLTVPGEIGEFRVQPVIMKGYVGNPEETEKAFDSKDRYKTGDLGYIDKGGDVYIIDRMKEMMKYRGYQIAPAELEGLLLQVPGIEKVCVLGRPHPEDGDLPVAFVVRTPGSSITAEEIKAIVANTLSDAKKLRGGVIFIDSLLHTSTGKIMRKKMKELLEKYSPE